MSKKINYDFTVEVFETGQRNSYGDSFYHYEVETLRPEYEVKNFCMNVLGKSYEKKDMPNPFAGKLITFEKKTNNNKGKSFLDEKEKEVYSYKYTTLFTG